jgi:hypothetical protein
MVCHSPGKLSSERLFSKKRIVKSNSTGESQMLQHRGNLEMRQSLTAGVQLPISRYYIAHPALFTLTLCFLLAFVANDARAQVTVHQSVGGSNVQVVNISNGSIVNIARDGDASINIASNLGAIQVQGSQIRVSIEGSIVNVAEGRDRVSRVNIGVNEAARTP